MAGGRPKQWPCLRTLDPAVVAADTVRLLVDRVRVAGEFLSPTISLALAGVGQEESLGLCRLGQTVIRLVRYAKGEQSDVDGAGCLAELGRCLEFEPARVSERPGYEPFLSVPSLVVLVLAVRGRIALQKAEELIPAAEYAALFNLDASTIRRRARREQSFGIKRNGVIYVRARQGDQPMNRKQKKAAAYGRNYGAKEEDPQCTCGHPKEEHGGDSEYPGSTSCSVEDCDCIAFEG